MSRLLAIVLLSALSWSASASVVYTQPPLTNGTLMQSSWWGENGSDWDILTWDNFTLNAAHPITEITWRGGFIYGGTYGGPVVDFTVAIYPSIAAGSEPDVTHPPLVSYQTCGNAGQSPAGVFGGTAMYDYHFTLPAPFQAAANTKYWLYICAWQNGIPEWGYAKASGGNGSHFRFVEGAAMYQVAPGDAAFSLISPDAPTFNISASVEPAGAGAVQGAGAYPANSTAAMVANANAGWGFANWTENNVVVSSSANYSFTVTADRTLVAHFVPAYAVTTSANPTFGGATSGDGVFNSGTSVTVHATANPHFTFLNWSEFGTPVSTSPNYAFSIGADRALTANFSLDSQSRMFDLNNAPVYTSLPIDLTEGGLSAHFSATGSGFSIQNYGTTFMQPAGFSGNYLYPNSVFAADLIIDFSAPLSGFSIMYSPQELGCDNSATMRATGYMDATQVATNTATAPVPGTWPTGTLTLDSAAPFNRVVVHYDARPPTCQDWGPIFLADNMLVTLAAAPCPGDLTGDRAVNLSDLSLLLSNYGVMGSATPGQGDLNGDGNIDLSDLAAMLAQYGVVCQ